MTNLENLGISKNRINALSKKGLLSVEDIQEFFPRKYYDFSTQRSLSEENRNQYIAVVGILKKVSTDKTNHTVMLKAKVEEELSGKTLHVMWIGSYYLKNIIKEWEQQKVNEQVAVSSESASKIFSITDTITGIASKQICYP